MSRGLRGLIVMCIALPAMLLGATPTPASGQMMFATGGAMGAGERLDSGDIDKLKEILELDEGQQLILDDLFTAYLADVEAARTEVRKIREAVEDEFERDDNMEVWREASKKFESYRNYLKRLRERMMADLELVLTEDQIPRIERFERHKRRSDRLGANFPPIRGASVDLIRMTERMELEPQTHEAVDPILERYELDMDRLIVENDIEEMLRSEFGDLDEIEIMQRMDDPMEIAQLMGRATGLMNKMRAVSRQFRDLNERTMRQMAGAVSEELAADLEKQFQQEAFPEVYADTEAESVLRTVAEFDDLSSEQRETINEITEGFERELRRLNNAWASALRAEDNKEQQGLFSMMRFGQNSELVKRIIADRNELSESTIARVRAVLGTDQEQRLPGSEVVDWRSMGDWDDL